MAFENVLLRMRRLIRDRSYVLTIHADEEMDADGLTISDVEAVFLRGQIVERQRDRMSGERKYRLRGTTGDGGMAEVIARIGPTGKVVVITVYRI